MKINNIDSTNFCAKAYIRCAENQKHEYLYNEILNLTNKYKIPANFRTEDIDLPSVSTDILKTLNKLKIKFYSGKKH